MPSESQSLASAIAEQDEARQFGSFESVRPQFEKIIRLSKGEVSCSVARVTNKNVIFCLPKKESVAPFTSQLNNAGWSCHVHKGLKTDRQFVQVYFNNPN